MPIENTHVHMLRRVRRNLFFILVAAVTVGFLGLIGPFIMTCFWGATISVIFYALYQRMLIFLRGRESLASFIATVLIFFFVLIPFGLLAWALLAQAQGLYAQYQNGEIDPNVVLNYVDTNLPKVASALSDFGISTADLRARIATFSARAGQFVLTEVYNFTGSFLNLFIQFTLMLYLVFFFFKDGKHILRALIDTVPMGNVRERAIFERFAVVARATLKGTLIVALVQGSIGGLMFWILGLPAPLLWGAAMTLLALLPVGGSAIVWFPTVVILFAQGAVGKAIALLVVGSLIIGLVDNLLRPLLVGRDTQMPDYLVLIATLGGITFFGLSGFVVGPVIAALFITVWEMMGREYGGKMG